MCKSVSAARSNSRNTAAPRVKKTFLQSRKPDKSDSRHVRFTIISPTLITSRQLKSCRLTTLLKTICLIG